MAAPQGLLRLPAELRNQIYRYLLCPGLTRGKSPVGSVEASTNFDTSIMFTNRQIYQEASYIFYGDHRFIRVQFSHSSYFTPNIMILGLEKTIRRNVSSCTRMIMTMRLDLEYNISTGSDHLPMDLVLAHHDLHLIDCLNLYSVHRQYTRNKTLDGWNITSKVRVHDSAGVAASLRDEYFMGPVYNSIRNLRSGNAIEYDNAEHSINEEIERGLKFSGSPRGVPSMEMFLLLSRLLRHLQRREELFKCLRLGQTTAEMHGAYWPPAASEEPAAAVRLLRYRIENAVLAFSPDECKDSFIREVLDRLPDYCQQYHEANPQLRPETLYKAIQTYLQFGLSNSPDEVSIRKLTQTVETPKHDNVMAPQALDSHDRCTNLTQQFLDRIERSPDFMKLSGSSAQHFKY